MQQDAALYTQDERAAQEEPRPRRRVGRTLGCLSVLVVLLLLIGALWTFGVRPYLHDMVVQQLDQAMDQNVKSVPDLSDTSKVTGIPGLPPGINVPIPPLTVSQDTLNNMIVLNLPQDSPVQNPTTRITPDNVRLSFTAYGVSCAISTLPALQNGQLVATNVILEGPIALILSSDDITALLNEHFAQAQKKLNRQIKSLKLNDSNLVIEVA